MFKTKKNKTEVQQIQKIERTKSLILGDINKALNHLKNLNKTISETRKEIDTKKIRLTAEDKVLQEKEKEIKEISTYVEKILK